MQAFRTRFSLLVLLGFVSVAATCEGPLPVDLDAEEGGRFTPSGRVAYEILPGNDQRRRGSLLDLVTGEGSFEGARDEGPPPRPIQPVISVVGEFARVDGRDTVTVPVGERLDFDGDINGPATASVRVTNNRGYVAGRGGVRFHDIVTLEGLFGLGLDRTEVRVRSGGVSRQEGRLFPNFMLGARASVRPVPLVDLYVQGIFMFFPMLSTDVEVGAQLNVTPNVGLYGGYRRWTYERESFSGRSDADFEFGGPTAGLSLTF